jgi:hypothetical protein
MRMRIFTTIQRSRPNCLVQVTTDKLKTLRERAEDFRKMVQPDSGHEARRAQVVRLGVVNDLIQSDRMYFV